MSGHVGRRRVWVWLGVSLGLWFPVMAIPATAGELQTPPADNPEVGALADVFGEEAAAGFELSDWNSETIVPTAGTSTEPPCAEEACCPTEGGMAGGTWLDHGSSEWDWLHSDERLLHDLEKRPLGDDFTYSVGGALRFRYLDERNRLRPPLAASRSSYQQWRFTPYLELGYNDAVKVYLQAIDASTFGNEAQLLPIDENRADMVQMYVDLKALELDSGDARYRYGRQTLLYGAQRLVSPLGWSNTYRNFEGHKLYYTGSNWNLDLIAVQPVDGASRNAVYNINSWDSPAVDQWLGGLYASRKDTGGGVLDLYWLWSDTNYTTANVLDGNRHTIGARWASQMPLTDPMNCETVTWSWDLEGAYQFGETDYLGPDQDVSAGFVSATSGLTWNDVTWTPNLSGVFWWGSGDSDPTDGTSHTVSTLYPLGHAYWGLIDNFNGSNLVDYSVQGSVKPTKKTTLLAAWHWFDKAAQQDAIYNIAGVPFGGVSTTPSGIGNELDLVATYKVNANLELQLGYFWFWYGDAVDQNPNAAVANRNDAEQVYFYVDWLF